MSSDAPYAFVMLSTRAARFTLSPMTPQLMRFRPPIVPSMSEAWGQPVVIETRPGAAGSRDRKRLPALHVTKRITALSEKPDDPVRVCDLVLLGRAVHLDEQLGFAALDRPAHTLEHGALQAFDVDLHESRVGV